MLAGGDEPPTKPDPQVLLRVCDRLGVRPNQTVVIGDADSDGLMAQRGVQRAALVLRGVGIGHQCSITVIASLPHPWRCRLVLTEN